MKEKVETAGEDHLKYKMSFTLRHLSATCVVAALWSNDRIRAVLKRTMTPITEHLERDCVKFEDVKQKVYENAVLLHVTKGDLKVLLCLIKGMGSELFKWIRFMDVYVIIIPDIGFLHVALDHLDSLVWTCMGQVDYKKTAMRLLRFGDLDVNLRFQLACDFCLEEDIQEVWNKNPPGINPEEYVLFKIWISELTERFRVPSIFYMDEVSRELCDIYLPRIIPEEDVLLMFWISELTGNFIDLEEVVKSTNYALNLNHNVKEFVFSWALQQRNETAARYMWDNHRKEFNDKQPFPKAIKEAGSYFNRNFMCHLLTQADMAEQEDSFECSYKEILETLLGGFLLDNYLWIDHYLPTLRRVKKFMKPNDFVEPLEDVSNFINFSHESFTCNFNDLFKELWQHSPKEHGVPMFDEILYGLFGRENKDMVKVILSDVHQRKEMLFSSGGINACKNFLKNNEWDLLEMFIERAFESEEDLNKFKKELVSAFYSSGGNISRYVTEDEWSWTEKFLNSSFKNTEEMVKLKLELALEDRNGVVTKLIKYSFDNGALDFGQVDDFLRWCLPSDMDRRKFKLEMITNEVHKWNTIMCELVCEFIEEDDFESPDLLLKWCISHKTDLREEIGVFKNRCLLEIFENATKMEKIIVGAFENDRLKKLLKWFDPTKEILKDCKELLSARDCPKLLLALLDDFIQGNK